MSAKTKSKAAAVPPLSDEEQATFAEHELIVSQGLKAFVAVGLSLLAIRDGKLYRAEHKTFEAYCQQRWSFSRQRGQQLIEAASIAQEMSTSGCQNPIQNERQARALAMVPPHLRDEVLDRVREQGEEITEQTVTKAVNALLEEKRAAAKEREQDGESEGDTEDEGAEAAGVVETPTEGALRRAAKRTGRERLYLARGLERLRLAVKDFRKLTAADLETAGARLALREGLSSADEAFSDARLLAGQVEEEASAAKKAA